MKISPVNTNMVYNNRNCKKPAFQAKIEEPLLKSLKQTLKKMKMSKFSKGMLLTWKV